MTDKLTVAERVAAALSEPGTTREAAVFAVAKALHAAGQVSTLADGIRQTHACLPPLTRAQALAAAKPRVGGASIDPVVAAIKKIHAQGGRPFTEALPFDPRIERLHYYMRLNKRDGHPEYRERKGKGVWSKKLPRQRFLEDQERKFRAAQHTVFGQARAAAAGVLARRRSSEERAEKVRALFVRLAERSIKRCNMVSMITRSLQKDGEDITSRTVDRLLKRLGL
jgi:hypothetical protein